MKPFLFPRPIALLAACCLWSEARAATLRVSQTLPPAANVFRTLRAAYAAASDGDVIQIDPGVFLEIPGAFSPEKHVNLVPSTGDRTIVSTTAPPPNDNFANRIQISGSNAASSSVNYAATQEINEPLHFSGQGGHSIWWSWTAPATGGAVFSTEGSDFDDGIAIYTGQAFPLFPVAHIAGGATTGSRLVIAVQTGVTYQIAVDGYGGAVGQTLLRIELLPPPENDDFANRIHLTGDGSFSIRAHNFNASTEPGEAVSTCVASSRSVWWSWSTPSAGKVALSIDDANFPAWLGVFTGNSLATIAPITLNTNRANSRIEILWNAEAGAFYTIGAGGISDGSGEFSLSLQRLFGTPFPTNDHFSQRVLLTGDHFSIIGQLEEATLESLQKDAKKSVWWTWTPPFSGLAKIDNLSSGVGLSLNFYTGSSLCELVLFDSASLSVDGAFHLEDATVFVHKGMTYQIAVSDLSSQNSGYSYIDLELRLYPPPLNDSFNDRIELTGERVSLAGSTFSASVESGETNLLRSSAGKSIWWSWTPPPTPVPGRPVTISTAGSTFDTFLAVYTNALPHMAPTFAKLRSVAENDNDPIGGVSSRVTFVPVPGTTYYIALDGEGGRYQRAGDFNFEVDYSTLNISVQSASFSCNGAEPCRDIAGQLLVRHFGDTPTALLRVSFLATNGYSASLEVGATGYVASPFPSTNLGSVLFPSPETLLPTSSNRLDFVDIHVPDPDPDIINNFGRAKGWAVYAILEELFGNAWLPVDSTLVLYGPWPRIDGLPGPNGGVIRSDPSRPLPYLLADIALRGPTVLCEAQSALVSGRAMFLTGGISNAQPNWVWTGPLTVSTNGLTTNALITVNPINADTVTTLSATLAFAGSTIRSTSNLTIRLLNDCFQFRQVTRQGNAVRLELVDRPGKRLAIEFAASLPAPTWIALATNTVGLNGHFLFTNTLPASAPQHFYRARELP